MNTAGWNDDKVASTHDVCGVASVLRFVEPGNDEVVAEVCQPVTSQGQSQARCYHNHGLMHLIQSALWHLTIDQNLSHKYKYIKYFNIYFSILPTSSPLLLYLYISDTYFGISQISFSQYRCLDVLASCILLVTLDLVMFIEYINFIK